MKVQTQFFRTTIGIKPGPDAFDESRFVMTFLTILKVTEILCSFKLVLEEKIGQQILTSSRLEILKRFLPNNRALNIRCRRQHLRAVEQRRYCRFTFVENTISNSLKVPRAQFLGINGVFCFISIWKFGCFKNPFATITCLSELYFRFRRFMLVLTKKLTES